MKNINLKEQYKGNLEWLVDRTIYCTIHGSHAYGTNVETSDIDIKGVCIPPKNYILGFSENFEQAEQNEPDMVIYSLHKFMSMASQCNPNIIEVLFTDPEFLIKITPLGKKLYEHRHLFLSKRVRHTFSGYAFAQLKRIKTHRAWLLNPPVEKPERKAFGLPEDSKISRSELGAFESLLEKKSDDIVYIDKNLVGLLQKEKAYHNALTQWRQYENWKKNRNQKRAELEAKYLYDCYTDDTEFLTNNGWKNFSEISEKDLLATVFFNKTSYHMNHKRYLGIEYQKPTNKFEGTFSGNLYRLFGTHTDTLVTPNHRMLFRPKERKTKKIGKFSLEEISKLPDTFECLRYPTPKKTCFSHKHVFKNIPIKKEPYLRLMGWYLSDGCAVFNKRKPTGIRISQKKNGKLYSSMKKFSKKYSKPLYEYKRKPNFFNSESIIEAVLSISGDIGKQIINDCGYKTNKRIPRWVYSLSSYLQTILLDSLIMGDGTKTRTDNNMIYYSKSKKLADDVQELALLAGYETSLYGPYKQNNKKYKSYIYHVHINKTKKQFKQFIRSKNIKKIPVKNQKIVCFTVPNGTLITRRNGHVGIHGNCKHGYHLVRLIRMAKEILTTGEVIVKRPDAQELLEIRNGAWSYDKLVGWAEEKEKELESLSETSNVLPNKPDIKKLQKLCIELVEEAI